MSDFSNNEYSWSFTPPLPQKPKKRNKALLAVLLVLICGVVSFGAGLCGALVAPALFGTDEAETTTAASDTDEQNAPQNDAQSNQQQETQQQNNQQQSNQQQNNQQQSTQPSGGSVSASGEGAFETISEVVASIADAVVVINVQLNNGSSRGSGVILSADGKIITCYHVIDGAKSITVTLNDGTIMEATVIGGDAETDLAMLSVTPSVGTNLTYVSYGDSSKLAVGERVIAIGNPLGTLGGTVTDGIISATARKITTSEGYEMTLLQTNAAINQGNSGGGLFNMNGELIGIVNAKYAASGVEGLAFAIPSNHAQTVAADLLEYGYVRGRVDSGLELKDIVIASVYDQYLYAQYGIYASGVYVITSAYCDDLQNADRITKVNGVAVNTTAEFEAAIEDCAIGDTIVITATRGQGDPFEVSITLRELVPASAQ